MIQRAVKKPVVIECIQYTGENLEEIELWIGQRLGEEWKSSGERWITIPTLEGDHRASVGDYIIKGVKGEFYPCKPGIFEQTYEILGQ